MQQQGELQRQRKELEEEWMEAEEELENAVNATRET
jgi:hypothetical protein